MPIIINLTNKVISSIIKMSSDKGWECLKRKDKVFNDTSILNNYAEHFVKADILVDKLR